MNFECLVNVSGAFPTTAIIPVPDDVANSGDGLAIERAIAAQLDADATLLRFERLSWDGPQTFTIIAKNMRGTDEIPVLVRLTAEQVEEAKCHPDPISHVLRVGFDSIPDGYIAARVLHNGANFIVKTP